MAKKKEKKKVEDCLIDYCSDDYEGDYISMAHDSVNPEYEANAS